MIEKEIIYVASCLGKVICVSRDKEKLKRKVEVIAYAARAKDRSGYSKFPVILENRGEEIVYKWKNLEWLITKKEINPVATANEFVV